MTSLKWDQVGERFYETGIDKGVLYLNDGTVVAWNGLTGVDESASSEMKSYYLDGAKYLQKLSPAEYSGKLKAFMYPDEFERVMGRIEIAPGLAFHEQNPQSFSLSYRTRIGDDLVGTDYAYRIHILYNLLANPEDVANVTLQDSNQPIEFSWSLSGTPPQVSGFRPTVHISVNSTVAPRAKLRALEQRLYGSRGNNPSLPTIQQVASIFGVEGL